jgi:hypothetical protein
MKRKMDKQLRSCLTKEQFEEIKSQVLEERVREENDRFIGNFVAVYLPAMRDNKISEERANKIIEDVFQKAVARYNKGEKGEPRPAEDKYIPGEKIIDTVEKVLKQHGIEASNIIAESIYNALMDEGEIES